jgi:hypothetical protein
MGINMAYTKVNNILGKKDLSDEAFRLHVLLQSMCYGEKNSCFPSQAYLTTALNKSAKSIQRYIKERVTAELIEKKRKEKKGKYFKFIYSC